MNQASAETLGHLVVGLGVLLVLLIIAGLVVQRFRGGAANKGLTASELMSNFQEMRKRGDISDLDYRKIKSVLGEQLQGDAKNGKDKGS
jgi:uncharacterized membrane protein